MGRIIEFFQGEDTILSMTRLLCFMSWFPATYVVVRSENENILGWYLGSYVLGFVGGKASDCIKSRRESDADISDNCTFRNFLTL